MQFKWFRRDFVNPSQVENSDIYLDFLLQNIIKPFLGYLWCLYLKRFLPLGRKATESTLEVPVAVVDLHMTGEVIILGKCHATLLALVWTFPWWQKKKLIKWNLYLYIYVVKSSLLRKTSLLSTYIFCRVRLLRKTTSVMYIMLNTAFIHWGL